MHSRISIGLFVVLFSLNGCGQDYSLSPPADSEKITVKVKVPKKLKTEAMWVMYRSTTCKSVTRGASGQRIERDGHHSVYKEFQRQEESDIYQIELPKDGGGACRWHLANVTFGVVYADPSDFGENVSAGAGGGVVVVFDYNNSPRGGTGVAVDGDLMIKKDYYPWISETFIGRYEKNITLLSESRTYYFNYQALQAKEVYFEPVLHSDFLVDSTGPKIKEKGNYAVFTYPDGSIEAIARAQPDFRKLQAIRLAAESKN
jgi:hypothetical protein